MRGSEATLNQSRTHGLFPEIQQHSKIPHIKASGRQHPGQSGRRVLGRVSQLRVIQVQAVLPLPYLAFRMPAVTDVDGGLPKTIGTTPNMDSLHKFNVVRLQSIVTVYLLNQSTLKRKLEQCVYVHIHLHIHTHTHIHIHIQKHTHIHIYIYTYTYTYVYIYMRIHMFLHICIYIFVDAYAWHGMAWHGMAWHGMAWHVCMCVCVHLYMHSHASWPYTAAEEMNIYIT